MQMSEKSVVVGVDGSPGSGVALEYAIEEAARRNALLRVVSAVALPDFWAASHLASSATPTNEIVGAVRKEAQSFVDDVIEARGGAGELPVAVEVRSGRPGEILVEAADGAELLVVGHRGRGSVASVLLGSVGLYCVLHALCPVTVVRPGGQTEPVAVPTEAAPAPA